MSARFQSFGAALENVATEVIRVGEALGPVTLILNNLGSSDVILAVNRLSDDSVIALDDDTAVTGHAFSPAYTGNTSTLDFTGSTVSHTFLIPGTVTVTPTTGGNSVNSSDVYQDGILYASISSVYVECGTVNYFTGAIDLHYPTGKAPNTGAITASFSYSSKSCKPLGKVTKRISNLPPSETFIVKALSKLTYGSSKVRIEGIVTF